MVVGVNGGFEAREGSGESEGTQGKGQGRSAHVSARGSILLERHNLGTQRAQAGSPRQPALTVGWASSVPTQTHPTGTFPTGGGLKALQSLREWAECATWWL